MVALQWRGSPAEEVCSWVSVVGGWALGAFGVVNGCLVAVALQRIVGKLDGCTKALLP